MLSWPTWKSKKVKLASGLLWWNMFMIPHAALVVLTFVSTSTRCLSHAAGGAPDVWAWCVRAFGSKPFSRGCALQSTAGFVRFHFQLLIPHWPQHLGLLYWSVFIGYHSSGSSHLVVMRRNGLWWKKASLSDCSSSSARSIKFDTNSSKRAVMDAGTKTGLLRVSCADHHGGCG